VSSSIFIGSSFIVKKQGLRIAGSSGIRAGECILSMHCSSSQHCMACTTLSPGRLSYYCMILVHAVP
jgi:hypothetical protein